MSYVYQFHKRLAKEQPLHLQTYNWLRGEKEVLFQILGKSRASFFYINLNHGPQIRMFKKHSFLNCL